MIILRFPINKNLIKYAGELRKNMTKEERHLWYDYLRNHECKFRRQEIIGNYILDFFSHEIKLAIEIDGTQHFTDQIDSDKERTKYLNGYGIRVIRFSNNDINFDFDNVCEYLDNIINSLSARKENPSG